MGNHSNKQFNSFADWEPLDTQNGIEIYRNTKNNQIAQKRTITIDPQYDLDSQFQIYHMRENNQDSLVRSFRAREVQKKGKSEGICSGHKKLEVLTERIPYQLIDLPQLTFPQSLLFLRQTLKGYNRIFKSYGPIHVTKKLIGINQLGEVKCWLNENWALNHPSHELPTLQSTKLDGLGRGLVDGKEVSQVYDGRYRDETEMVHNIVAVIEQKCEQGQFPSAFSEEVYLHSGSFRKLSSYVQDFIRINELFIPPRINYETVLVSKYQKQVTQQNAQQSINNKTVNEAQWAGHTITNQPQSISSLQTNNNLINGYQQNYSYQQNMGAQSLGYSQNQLLSGTSLPSNTATYTLNKTTTTTYGNTAGTDINGYSTTYQPTTTYSPSKVIPPTSTINTNTFTVPWQKSQSVYKLPQTQSSYSSSYYQYSATNPSSIGMTSYKFGAVSSGTQLQKQPIKPSSYTLNNTLLNATSYNLSNNQNTLTSLENRFGVSSNDNPSSPYQNLAGLNLDQKYEINEVTKYTTPTPSKQSYEEFKKNFPSTLPGTNTYSYSSTYQVSNKVDPAFTETVQKGSTFSFDGRKQLGTKFTEYSSGQGALTGQSTYETSYNTLSGPKVQGKYSSQFNNLLGPLLGYSKKNQIQDNRPSQLFTQGNFRIISGVENSLKQAPQYA